MSTTISYKTITLAEDTTLDENLEFEFSTFQYKNIGIQVVWADLEGTLDASLDVQESCDGETWKNAKTSETLDSVSGNSFIKVSCFFPKMKVKITQNDVSDGKVSVFVNLK